MIIQYFMKDKIIITSLFLFTIIPFGNAQETSSLQDIKTKMDLQQENLGHRLYQLAKQVDDILWQQKVGDITWMDKLYIYGSPPWKEKNPTSMSDGNPVKFWTYAFFPKNPDADKKYPLILLPHGGIHADFTTYYTHIIRELVSRGYVVAAPEYRGSTGYGRDLYEKIDYGGRENDDVRNTPLLIHNNTNDDDVNVLEVEQLIKSLKAEG
jgi:hypothetical protein